MQGAVLDLHACGDDAEAALYELAHLIDSKCDDLDRGPGTPTEAG